MFTVFLCCVSFLFCWRFVDFKKPRVPRSEHFFFFFFGVRGVPSCFLSPTCPAVAATWIHAWPASAQKGHTFRITFWPEFPGVPAFLSMFVFLPDFPGLFFGARGKMQREFVAFCPPVEFTDLCAARCFPYFSSFISFCFG